jgi:hypothetical protein
MNFLNISKTKQRAIPQSFMPNILTFPGLLYCIFLSKTIKYVQILSKREGKMKFKLTEELWKEGNMYVSYCPELDIASCGETVDQAKTNLKEVILINLEEA